MAKRAIRVKFTGYKGDWGGAPHYDKMREILARNYNLIECDDPDYLFFGGLNHDHYEYDCIKIAQIAENFVPDFNAFDYAVAMNELSFGDRYLRIPHFAYYPEFRELHDRRFPSDAELLGRGFCSYVVSNGGRSNPLREEFFRRLSRYKTVASGGKFMNNVGGPVPDKLAFCAKYKFNIAFENSAIPGYTTEKIMQPLTVNSIPIYFGNPSVEADFNPSCMVRVKDANDVERAVEEIIRLDTNDALYLERCKATPLVHSEPDYYDRQLEEFLRHIIDAPLDEAKRVSRFGYQRDLVNQMRHMVRINKAMRRMHVYQVVDFVRKVKGALSRG